MSILKIKNQQGQWEVVPAIKGDQGPQGATGATGATGPAGQDGVTPQFSIGTVSSGTTAAASLSGTAALPVLNLTLPKGDTGDTGATPSFSIGTVSTGAAGSSASASITGTSAAPVLNLTIPKGDKGDQGNKGDTGNTGATPDFSIGTVSTGAAGSSASATITGTVAAPVLNLTIPKGDKGDKGDTGNTGATPAFSIGTVSTGAAGSSASATITGSAAAPVLNLTIPRGNTGATGETGATGATGATPDFSIGTVTTGNAGSSASATITGTAAEPVLNLTIPRGDTGATGTTPAFSIGTVSTGNAGSSASATITGTAAAPVLNLTIPRGDKGETGSTGATGATGATPSFSIGTVSTGAAGSSASATITGTDAAPVLNLTIPRGNTGNTGTTPNFSIGTVTTGAAGSSASATITGTAAAPVLNLTIPKGDTGANGTNGTNGTNGVTPDFSIGTVTTGAAGSSAAATITGTTAAPVLNLTIPKGDTGSTGATPNFSIGTVSTGAAGSSASASITGTAAAPVLNLTIPKGDTGSAGATGATPSFSIGTVTGGSTAAATITGTDAAPVLNLTLPKGDDANLVIAHATCATSSISSANWTVDKTFQELYDAYQAGKTLLLYVRRTYSSAKMAALLHIDGYTAPSSSSIAFSGLKTYPDNSNSGNCVQKLKFIISSTNNYTYTGYDIADKTPGAVVSNYIGEYGSSSFYFGLDANDNLALFAVAEVYTLADLYNDFGSTMAQRPITKLILYGWIDEQIDTYPYRVNYNAYQCDGLDWYQFYDENTSETTDRYRVVFSTRYLNPTTQQSIIRVLVAEGDGTEDLCSDGLPFTVHDIQDGSPGRGIAAINATGSSGGVDTYTITYTDNTTSTFTVTNGTNYVLTSQDKQDIITELAEEFTDDTGWEDLSSYIKPSLVTCNSCLFRRIGNVVYIKFDFNLKGTLNASTWLTINQTSNNVAIPLPEQWRPTNTIFIYGCSQTPGAYFRVTYDGYIAIRNQTGAQVKGTDAGGSWWIQACGDSYFVSSGILPSGLTEVSVSGTTPTIVAESNTRYLCGTVLSLDFTPPATGITDVVFTAGSTLPVLTFPNTVKFPDWFEVDTNTTYEINILNGVYAVVAEWEAT